MRPATARRWPRPIQSPAEAHPGWRRPRSKTRSAASAGCRWPRRSRSVAKATTAASTIDAGARTASPATDITAAKTSDSRGCRRPSGTGRSLVRRINPSGSRSITWLNADAPPATRAVPATVHTTRAASEISPPRHHIADERRADDEQVEARLRERDEVTGAAARLRDRDRFGARLQGRAPRGSEPTRERRIRARDRQPRRLNPDRGTRHASAPR